MVAELPGESGDLPKQGRDVAVEGLHPEGRHQYFAQNHLGDGIKRHAARLALPGIVL